jgi:hypothetical protein
MLVANQATAADEAPEAALLEEVVVTGTFPGPGLWKVTHADADHSVSHTLWLAAQPPLLPQGMHWKSEEVEQVAAQAQLIVFDGSLSITVDGPIGMLRALTLVPSVLRARKNPNGERLEQLLSPALYDRWHTQKLRVLGRDRGVEKLRPMFAAEALRDEALKQFKGSAATTLHATLRRIAKEKGIRTTAPAIWIKIPAKEMRGAVKRFSAQPLNDRECFSQIVEFVAALADDEEIHTRAKAWAIGDLDTLHGLAAPPAPRAACNAALLSSEAAAPYTPADPEGQLRMQWLETVEESLRENENTLATLPLHELLSAAGRLNDLREKGYSIEEPR